MVDEIGKVDTEHLDVSGEELFQHFALHAENLSCEFGLEEVFAGVGAAQDAVALIAPARRRAITSGIGAQRVLGRGGGCIEICQPDVSALNAMVFALGGICVAEVEEGLVVCEKTPPAQRAV
jgi:hypothetical protein